MTEEESGNYRAYLLRFWRDDDDSPWRATLENPHTNESLGFASMVGLFKFLDDQTGQNLLSKYLNQAADAADL